jgi:mono/diheme cytochrome c family protein
MTSPAEVLPLERSQGDRQPRNEHELKAQGYMLGACANCHNPRGFPSIKSPELKSILDMFPSGTGGVFQCPLERFSPLRKRGFGQDVPMPYITPSLREYPVDREATDNWTPKWFDCATKPVWKDCLTRGSSRYRHLEAPWRSLLYRNVDTPYTYVDDFVVFPRMPMHGPGFDCRLPGIMGDWMVSVPAVRKNTEAAEDTVPGGEFPADREPQPYREVRPGESGYDQAVAAAAERLKQYHEGGRYGTCSETTDIVDPVVRGNPGDPLVPEPGDVWGGEDKQTLVVPNTRVPLRPHWVVTDLTEPGGDWNPRRANWADFLVKGTSPSDPVGGTDEQAHTIRRQRTAVRDALAVAKITPALRSLSLASQPFGLWEAKPDCADALARFPTAGSIPQGQRPRWLERSKPPAEARLYTQSPGQAVYATICVNCHGPAADSKGLMSEAIMLMSGGEARVANFRDGLFGPVSDPGGNRDRVFGSMTVSGATAEEVAARYMSWMALGGTEQRLPQAVLNIVATTRVLGKTRAGNKISPKGSPNMLELARELCAHTLPAFPSDPVELDLNLRSGSIVDWGARTGLIDDNLDAEMWQRLCAQDNRQIVRVPFAIWTGDTPRVGLTATESLYFADGYPADAEVMDQRGRVQKGITPDNLFPLCIRTPSPAEKPAADKWLAEHPVGGPGGPPIPYCPEKLFEPGEPGPEDPPGVVPQRWKLKTQILDNQNTVLIDVERWSLRGAINAGIAVFLYLDQLERGAVQPLPPYNKCEELVQR